MAHSNGESADKEKTQPLTITVKPSILEKFKRDAGPRGVSKAIENLMVKGSSLMDELSEADEGTIKDLLITMVGDALRDYPRWAKEVAQRMHLRLPSGLVLRKRTFRHYRKDKQHVAAHFSEWLARRIGYWLEKGYDIALFLDAGSAVLWFAMEFWPHLATIANKQSWAKRSINIYTNNLAVGERYVCECEENRIAQSRIRCELLGGIVDPDYAALTGANVEERIKGVLSTKGCKSIAILAGNYIRVHAGVNELPLVSPLVRGPGQWKAKTAYTGCNELYILGCIGKLWPGTTGEINTVLDVKKGKYEEVAVASGSAARLITTIRTLPTAILKSHSNCTHGMLGAPQPPKLNTADGDFNGVPHFCYPYDEPIKNLARLEQVEVEFPHESARTPAFMKYYDVTP